MLLREIKCLNERHTDKIGTDVPRQVLVPSPASEPSLYAGASGIQGMLPFLTTTEHFSSSFLQSFPKTFLLFLTLNLVALSEGKRKLTLPIQA